MPAGRMYRFGKKRSSKLRRRLYRKVRRTTVSRLKLKPVAFKRTFCLNSWAPATINATDFWKYYQFRMTDLPNLSEYQALFDTYKINGIKVTFRPRFDNYAGNDTTDITPPGVTNQGACYLHLINDPYSTVTPSGTYTRTNLNSFLENGNVKSVKLTRPVSIYVKPTMTDSVGSGLPQAVRPKYLSLSNNANIVHNGFHAFISDVNMTGLFNQAVDVFVTYYFSCKGMQ